jgi:GNAT superfamily N-acetyltransferase
MSGDRISTCPVHTKSELKVFIKFPWRIYENDPFWIPPLINDQKKFLNRNKNPFFEHGQAEYFIAYENGTAKGRIAAVVNQAHDDHTGEKAGFFGFFECVEDFKVARSLFDAAIGWLKEKGARIVYGPESFSTNDECGFLLEGFDRPPVVMMPYSKPYYLAFAEQYGFTKAKDLYAYYLDKETMKADRLIKLADRIKQRAGFTVRTLDMRRFRSEVDIISNIYNGAWNSNWGFVPMTESEIGHMASELKPIVDPGLVFFAEVEGEPAGFAVALPDYNQVLAKINGKLFPLGLIKLLIGRRKIDSLRIITLGTKNEYQKRGIETVLIAEIIRAGFEKGFYKGELSWTLEDNILINRSLERLGGDLYKKYRIYSKEL